MALFAVLALIGFVASVVVHASTFLPGSPLGMDRTWPLHIGIFLTFAPAVLSQRRASGGNHRKSLRETFPDAPRWMRTVLSACAAYAVVNFVVFMIFTAPRKGDRIWVADGRYVVHPRGGPEREVSEADYRRQQARVARGFSGHWMIFYWASLVGIVDGRRRRRCEGRGDLSPTAVAIAADVSGRPQPLLHPWTHSSLLTLLTMACFMGFPVILVTALALADRAKPNVVWPIPFCPAAILFFGSAIFGAIVPARWVARRVPARCPHCGGRTFARGAPVGGSAGEYDCADCGTPYSVSPKN